MQSHGLVAYEIVVSTGSSTCSTVIRSVCVRVTVSVFVRVTVVTVLRGTTGATGATGSARFTIFSGGRRTTTSTLRFLRALSSRRMSAADPRRHSKSIVCPGGLVRNSQPASTFLFSLRCRNHCSVCSFSATCQTNTAPGVATAADTHAINFFLGDIGYPEFLGLLQPKTSKNCRFNLLTCKLGYGGTPKPF